MGQYGINEKDLYLVVLRERAERDMRLWFTGNEGKNQDIALQEAERIAVRHCPDREATLAILLTNDLDAWTIEPEQGAENIFHAIRGGIRAHLIEAAMGEWEYRHNEHTGNWPQMTYAQWEALGPAGQAEYPEFLKRQEREDMTEELGPVTRGEWEAMSPDDQTAYPEFYGGDGGGKPDDFYPGATEDGGEYWPVEE